MTQQTIITFMVAGYLALIAVLAFGFWWRSKLIRWAENEKGWLRRECAELQKMRKFVVEQNTWDERRVHYSTPLVTSTYNIRVSEYNRRREQYLEVVKKIPRLLPW